MSTALLVAAATVGGLACPLHMWWQRRRGRKAACCASRGTSSVDPAEEIRARQETLSEQIAGLRAGDSQSLAGSP